MASPQLAILAPQVYGVKCIDEEMEGEDTGTSGPDGLPPAGYSVRCQKV